MNWESRFYSFMVHENCSFGCVETAAGETTPTALTTFVYFHKTGEISAFGESYAFIVENAGHFVNAAPCFRVHPSCSKLYNSDNIEQRNLKKSVILLKGRFAAGIKKAVEHCSTASTCQKSAVMILLRKGGEFEGDPSGVPLMFNQDVFTTFKKVVKTYSASRKCLFDWLGRGALLHGLQTIIQIISAGEGCSAPAPRDEWPQGR